MKKEINVGIIGASFMGKAHSNAYLDVSHYFDLPVKPVMKVACDKNPESLDLLVGQYGWQERESSWERLVERDDIDLIDICTPNMYHKEIAIAAAKNGKHVICEKPLCMNANEAKEMLAAAEKAGVKHMTAFNYRKIPAIALAKKLIDSGKIGKIHHFNAVYYQDWLVDPDFPFVWRHDLKAGGSGAHGDMNAHTIDLARFLVGEVSAVSALDKVFIEERKKSDGSGSAKVTADDAMVFLAKFDCGAIGNFMATRFATGRKNYLRIEIFGSEGALSFNLENLNELDYFSRQDDVETQGFRKILVTEQEHPYMQMWWPPGHIIGWEHTFIHEIGDLLLAIGKEEDVKPNFYDGFKCQQVLDAVLYSATNQKWVEVPDF
ncbi:MAG: Gfo/Idh/MocA family oxidoreductase [Cyclobacteriaceae bacterium]|nr:Gfo/Idh/MocA family oxidoreductase [Cyclobacteriaceae bacterium]